MRESLRLKLEEFKEVMEETRQTEQEKIDYLTPERYFRYIPKRFHDKTLDNYNFPSSEKEKLKQAVLSGSSLLITGPIGVGKTHLAVALGYEFWKKQMEEDPHVSVSPVRFTSCADFFIDLKTCITSGISEADFIRDYLAHSLLIFDDLGTEKVSDWSKQVFYTLFNRAYVNMKQMIITTNLSVKEIAEWYDARIPSRIAEMGMVVGLGGKDRRLAFTNL